ncbi:Dolichyldiphosphatase [Purpureocillium takamizusanense]|uniref:Dolichyldiphosphatase n=1 Tax=Purpureocillium takamizusanense TaxID=2060973 RepID=A0A9Q8QDZ8_9HYPO|nr:Dolichyldiphosphatase [Purpureocillium takamizusanense]UNI19029.1 Dolichyldiphosphatase [Purpureocillium takamizusanense]
MADSAPLASLSLTHVYYDPDDRLSLVCAYLALVPQALCIVYATLVLATREAEIALALVGQLACEALNFALKRLIKEERPRRIHGKGYGMPSSHAQFVAFWSVSLALFLLLRHRPRPATTTTTTTTNNNNNENSAAAAAKAAKAIRSLGLGSARLDVDGRLHRPWSLPERLAVSLAAAGVAVAVAWSRIYLDYHTPRQVLAGIGAGVASALAWFAATAVLRRSGLLAWALDLPLARALRVRDLAIEEDMCQAGWEKWEAKRSADAAAAAAVSTAGNGKAKTG